MANDNELWALEERFWTGGAGEVLSLLENLGGVHPR
jgi:hypothetical protein